MERVGIRPPTPAGITYLPGTITWEKDSHETHTPSGCSIDKELMQTELFLPLTKLGLVPVKIQEGSLGFQEEREIQENFFEKDLVFLWDQRKSKRNGNNGNGHNNGNGRVNRNGNGHKTGELIPIFRFHIGNLPHEMGDITRLTNEEILENVLPQHRKKQGIHLNLARNYLTLLAELEAKKLIPDTWPGMVRKNWKPPSENQSTTLFNTNGSIQSADGINHVLTKAEEQRKIRDEKYPPESRVASRKELFEKYPEYR